jgi:hypothetical protein
MFTDFKRRPVLYYAVFVTAIVIGYIAAATLIDLVV